MKLYEITNAVAALLNETDDGELAPAVEQQLDALQMDLAAKVEQCAFLVRNWDAEAVMLKAEADRFAKRAQSAEAKVKRFKAYVMSCLATAGVQKIQAGLFQVRTQVNGVPTTTFTGSVDKLPVEFKRVKVELDTAAVVTAWRDGLPLPDGVTCVRGSHLRIQ